MADNKKTTSYPETADIETSSDDYASRFAGSAGAWMLSVQKNATAAMLAAQPGATILDVGGGHGQLAIPLAALGFKITVLGSDESCRKRIAGLVDKGECKFKTGNLINLPYPDKAFDNVMSFRLLPHCTQWQKLVSELCRVARTSVIVDYPTTQSLNCFSSSLYNAKKQLEKNTRPFSLFKHADINAEFLKYGFVPETKRGEFFIPMVVHRMLRFPPLSMLLEGICRITGLSALFGSPVIIKMRRMTAEETAKLKAKKEKEEKKARMRR